MRTLLGKRIKHYRELRGLSQKALSTALKADKGTIWRWEDGRSWPEYPALESLAKQLGIDVVQLFENITGKPAELSPEQALEIVSRTIKAKKSPALSLVPDSLTAHPDFIALLEILKAKPGAIRRVLGSARAIVDAPDKAKTDDAPGTG